MARGESVRVFGDPKVARDYVHVDDVAAFMLALHRRATERGPRPLPPVMNVGSGVPTSLNGLLAVVSEAAGRPVRVRREEGRPFDRRSNWLDTSFARAELGWRATVPFADGVRQCWEHVLAARTWTARVRADA